MNENQTITVKVDDVPKKSVVVAPLSAADTAGQISRSLASGRAKWDEKGNLVVIEHGAEIPVVLSPESQRQIAAAQAKRDRRRGKAERHRGVRSWPCLVCREGWIIPGEGHCDNCGAKPEGGR